ncbi:Hypothetical predicted protein [Paramuricea clavata]|uniref:Uncharacterized protein n=1 Tax=Paramuricea clavata TaxID=317549 RepID=A0A6S7I096_PARCT|nr:Hypothetical predicted protein [Paramuricea clavata]
MLKCLYFATSTPLFSSLAISQATPSLQDPVPRSWQLVGMYHEDDKDKLVNIPKVSLHLFDVDSGEIPVVPENEQGLHSLVTHRNKIRFRMRNCDAPKNDHLLCIYKQPEGSKYLFESKDLCAEWKRAIGDLLGDEEEAASIIILQRITSMFVKSKQQIIWEQLNLKPQSESLRQTFAGKK